MIKILSAIESRTALITAAFGVSSIGDGIRVAVLPMLAVTITDSPITVSIVAMVGRLPWLAIALFSGAIADRYDRRFLMILADCFRALVVVILGCFFTIGTGQLAWLIVAAFTLGVGDTIFDTATQGLLPQIIGKERLGQLNGRIQTINMVGESFVGPLLGGWLFVFSRVVPLFANILTFAASAILIAVHWARHETSRPDERSDLGRSLSTTSSRESSGSGTSQ